VLQQADDSATQLINKQREIIEEQEAFASQQASSMEHVVELHRQLSEITIDSQNQLNALTSQPNEMFNYIRQTLEQFQRIAQFVETYANQDMISTNQRVEYIDAQLQNMKTAQDAINGFCQVAQSDLEKYLQKNREQLETAARNFVQSWNTMFTHMAATGQNPLVYLEQISVLIERVNDIKGSLSESMIDPQLYDELGKIRNALESIKSSNKLTGKKRPTGDPKLPGGTGGDPTVETPWWRRMFRKKKN
jgi:ABC-type transporter Mla subunit MlaD